MGEFIQRVLRKLAEVCSTQEVSAEQKLLMPGSHVLVDFTEFYAPCNIFSHIKHV